MDTTVPDTYLQQIHVVRTHIHACFIQTHDLLTVREDNLIRELEDIKAKYEKDARRYQAELQGLELSKQTLNNNLRNNDTLSETLDIINRDIEQIIKLSSETKTITFKWDTDFERNLHLVGKITTSQDQSNLIPAIPDYRIKSIPIVTCCKHGDNQTTAHGEIYRPRGITIDKETGRIFIADCANNRVQVVSSNGADCFTFNHKMTNPWGICIHNNTIYVSQFSGHCITTYNLDGAIICKIGSRGNLAGQFNYPTGLVVSDKTGYLYVCDFHNHRIQIIIKSLKFHSMFGDNFFNHPRDVKITTEFVIVLDENTQCIHLFNSSDHSLLKNIISRGDGEQVGDSLFFAIDREVNIILTDCNNHCVKVFSKEGDLIAQFGKEGNSLGEFIKPRGVAIDRQIRIVVVSQNKNTALQIF